MNLETILKQFALKLKQEIKQELKNELIDIIERETQDIRKDIKNLINKMDVLDSSSEEIITSMNSSNGVEYISDTDSFIDGAVETDDNNEINNS